MTTLAPMPRRENRTAEPGDAPRKIATRRRPPTSCTAEPIASTQIAAACSRRGSSEVIGRAKPFDDAVAQVVGDRSLEAGDRCLAGGRVHVQADEAEEVRPAGPLDGDVLDAGDRHDRPHDAPRAVAQVELLVVQLPAPAAVAPGRHDRKST